MAAVWLFLGWERIGIARGIDDGSDKPATPDNNFTVTGSKAVSDVDISVPDLMALCLTENDRRFAGYDARLLRSRRRCRRQVRRALRMGGPLALRVSGRAPAMA